MTDIQSTRPHAGRYVCLYLWRGLCPECWPLSSTPPSAPAEGWSDSPETPWKHTQAPSERWLSECTIRFRIYCMKDHQRFIFQRNKTRLTCTHGRKIHLLTRSKHLTDQCTVALCWAAMVRVRLSPWFNVLMVMNPSQEHEDYENIPAKSRQDESILLRDALHAKFS